MLSLMVADFDADPSVVTDILGIAPTFVARKGELSRSGRPHRANLWLLEEGPERLTSKDLHSSLENLLARLEGKSAAFSDLRTLFGPLSSTITGGLFVDPDEQAGFWLSPEDARRLSDLGLGWGLDIYVDALTPSTASPGAPAGP